jgi:hypothetical protein
LEFSHQNNGQNQELAEPHTQRFELEIKNQQKKSVYSKKLKISDEVWRKKF